MKRTTLFFLCLIPMFLKAQPMSVDSLINLLDTQKNTPSEQLDIYYKICGVYLFYDIEKASEYADVGLKLAEKERDKVMASKFNAIFGRIYGTKSDYATAFAHYEKALALAIEAQDNNQKAAAYADIGIIYARQDKYVPALDYFMKALAIYENIGDKRISVKVMSNISSMYRGLGNNERVIYYLEKAKKLAEDIEFDEGKMQVYFELGAIYHTLASNEGEGDKAKVALDYELKAYEISHKLGYKIYQAATAHALSAIYADYLNDYDKALEYAREALQIARETGDSNLVAATLNSISTAYRAQKRYRECEEAAMEAWKIDSTEINTVSGILENIILSNIAMENSDKATLFFDKYNSLTKKHIDQSSREMLADMEAKYETEKKEIRIAALEKDRKLYIGLGSAIMIALLLGTGFLFYRHRLATQKRKLAEQQIKQLEQEKQLIATRSALDAEKSEREIIARDLHDGVGAMLSVVKNNMDIMKSYSIIETVEADCFNKALDVLEKSITELRRVAHHIMPSILIDKGLAIALDDFCRSVPEAEFHCTEQYSRFDPEKELVLYRCAYELINNALRHAKASSIDVHLNMDEEMVYLSVVDNGCGFDPQTSSMGMGINNMRTRLSVFGGRIDIYSAPEKGTEANIELGL